VGARHRRGRPGTRLTTFLSGCPLQCLYCHNPDTLADEGRQPVTSDELLTRIARYPPCSRRRAAASPSPAARCSCSRVRSADPARREELGIHTAIDTSGYLGAARSDAMLDDVDLVLLDVKSGDPETYRR
jgi:pyruvate formate lyase activating enzyme